jgi:hypothetical protein
MSLDRLVTLERSTKMSVSSLFNHRVLYLEDGEGLELDKPFANAYRAKKWAATHLLSHPNSIVHIQLRDSLSSEWYENDVAMDDLNETMDKIQAKREQAKANKPAAAPRGEISVTDDRYTIDERLTVAVRAMRNACTAFLQAKDAREGAHFDVLAESMRDTSYLLGMIPAEDPFADSPDFPEDTTETESGDPFLPESEEDEQVEDSAEGEDVYSEFDGEGNFTTKRRRRSRKHEPEPMIFGSSDN